MRNAFVVLLIGLLATSAVAGDNPLVRAYIDFDPPNYEHCYNPTPYETFNAYFMLDCVPGGVSAVSFLLTDPMVECPGVFAPASFTNLFPGDLMIGNPFVAPGATVASTVCLYDDPLTVGYITLFYLGGDCCIQVMDHWDFPRWVLDCQDPAQVDPYCVLSHGEISSTGCPADICPPGDPDCLCEEYQPNPDVGLALHVDVEGHDCDFHLQDCAFANTSAPWIPGQLLDFVVMACFFPEGFTGAEYSLMWPPEWTFVNWQSCADFDEDPFDGTNGDGTIQWWDDCQPAPGPAGGPHTLGILTLQIGETRGPAFILPHPGTGVAGVYNCIPTLDVILPDPIGNGRAGYVYIGGQDGCNPCYCVGPPCWPYPAAIEDKTWGEIKAMYR